MQYGSLSRVYDELIYDMPYENYIARGMFTDLYEFMDADSEMSRDKFLTSILDALSTEGKLYMIAPSFSVQTLAAKTKFVGDNNGMNMDDFLAAVENTLAANDGMRVFQDLTRDYLLEAALCVSYDDFIDKNTGECTFDSSDFVKVLEFASKLDTKSIWEDINYDEIDEQFWLDQ